MNFIKNICARAFNAVANFIGKSINAVVQYTAPLVDRLFGDKEAPEVSFTTVFNFLKGIAIFFGLSMTMAVVSTFLTAGLTMLFGLVLPLAIANLLAVIADVVLTVTLLERSKKAEGTFGFFAPVAQVA